MSRFMVLVVGPALLLGTLRAAIIDGNARFQVLQADLVRLEYSPSGRFVDEPSLSVIRRSWPEVHFQTSRQDGWLEIRTAAMTVRYQSGFGPFAASNLKIEWNGADGEHGWKPGDADDRNLGGVPAGDIAARTAPGSEAGALSRNGYFLLDDSRTALRDAGTHWVKPRGNQGGQDWYFFTYGQNFKRMLGLLAQLLGPIPMVPRYVFGTWCGSRAGYSADEWKMIASRLREERIPADMLVLDSNSMRKVIWSGYDWDYEQMPDPKEFFQWALAHGFHVTINEHYEPLTRESDSNFEELRKLRGLPADALTMPHDLADQKYAQAFMDLLHKPALDMGMAFWWQDGAAPAGMEGLDPMLWTREVEYEGSERTTNKRAFVFCRLGTWGSHRYGAYFSGDLAPYWSSLNLLIPFNVQGGNMLVAYINNLNGAVLQETIDPELYRRWMQFSAFSPIVWWHGLWGLRLPWEYGAGGMETARTFLGLRYRLLPYTYTFSRLAHETGLPLARGMYVEYPEQEGSYSYRHQYMWGQDLLVAPISEPGYGEPVLKDIYLPKGDDWFDYFTGRVYRGGRVIQYECPMERMPLFVRAGAIVPTAPEMNYTGERTADPLTVHWYAGKMGKFRLYEDDGISLEYRNGRFAWTPIESGAVQAGEHQLHIGLAEGSYAGQPQARRYEVRVHGLLKPAEVLVAGRSLREIREGDWSTGWYWDPNLRVTVVRIGEPTPATQSLQLRLAGAGSYEDAIVVQEVLDFRERVRRVKQEEKLKWAILLAGLDIKKPPRVLRETDAVEAELNAIVERQHGVASHVPDFRQMAGRILHAFVDQPFECNRKIPESDEEARRATQKIQNATFNPEEIRVMTAQLMGCNLLVKTSGSPEATVAARLACDPDATGPVHTRYELLLPQEAPGVIETGRTETPEGYTRFTVRIPFPPPRGNHRLQVRAVTAWDGGEAEVSRDADWFSTGQPSDVRR